MTIQESIAKACYEGWFSGSKIVTPVDPAKKWERLNVSVKARWIAAAEAAIKINSNQKGKQDELS